jgi:hypothetical protein
MSGTGLSESASFQVPSSARLEERWILRSAESPGTNINAAESPRVHSRGAQGAVRTEACFRREARRITT